MKIKNIKIKKPRRWEEGNGRSRLLHVLKPVMLFIFVFYILEMRLEKCYFLPKIIDIQLNIFK